MSTTMNPDNGISSGKYKDLPYNVGDISIDSVTTQCIMSANTMQVYYGTREEFNKLLKSEKLKYGEVFITNDDSIYMYDGTDKPVELTNSNNEMHDVDKPKQMHPITCINCGGNFDGIKCKWCDTLYSATKWG